MVKSYDMTEQDMSWCESGYISHHTTLNQIPTDDDSTIRDSTMYDEDTITEQPTSLECIDVNIRHTSRSVTSTTSSMTLLFEGFADCMQPMRSAFSTFKDHFNPYVIDARKLDIDPDRDYYSHGMEGTIMKGKHLGHDVAVKRLLKRNAFNPELIEKLARLQHKNVVHYIGYTLDPPQYVMEFLPGGTLDTYIRNGGEIDPNRLISWSGNIANGLEHIHRLHVIHCDLKSANLMLDASGQAIKIIDFESCVIIPPGHDEVPMMKVRGTTPYMSPEMVQQLPCTTMVDIWAFGVILWEMVTLKAPYKNFNDEYVFYGIGMNKISLPINEDIPEGVKLLLQMCWKQAPEARPEAYYIKKHLEELAKELDRTSTETYRQSQMSWREECEYQTYQFDIQEIEQWTKDLKNYRVLQMRYAALMTSYNNLYEEYKKLKKEQDPADNTVKIFTRKRQPSKKSKKKACSKSSLLMTSSNNVCLTRAVSAPTIASRSNNNTLERNCMTPKANTLDPNYRNNVRPSNGLFLQDMDNTSAIDSDGSRCSEQSARLGDIESGPESPQHSPEHDKIVLPYMGTLPGRRDLVSGARAHVNKGAALFDDDDTDSAFCNSQFEIRDGFLSSSLIDDEFGEESLDKYGVRS